MSKPSIYDEAYRHIDFRRHPEKYQIGIGEQGVLIVEPYKSEIGPLWRFATPETAKRSAIQIYDMYKQYRSDQDFVGMDMARKYLQMGFTRARRYANHSSGKKYNQEHKVIEQDAGSETSPKAIASKIFYGYYRRVYEDPRYKQLKTRFVKRELKNIR
jgi:hypothetical protein